VLGVKNALDASRAFYMGLSLGGISGSMTFATTKEVNAAGLFVAAGGYPEIVSKGLFSALVANIVNRPTPERETLLGLAEVILDGADPLAYALRVEERSARPRPALFMQAIGDPVVPEPSSDQWARAFGAGLALPLQHAVAGMAELALPVSDNFAFTPGGSKATRVLMQNPMQEIPAAQRHGALIVQEYSQKAVAHCFSTWLTTGSCEAMDSGFAAH
jgi:pimeloyl-ACP methyl ester carboxylesterase